MVVMVVLRAIVMMEVMEMVGDCKGDDGASGGDGGSWWL